MRDPIRRLLEDVETFSWRLTEYAPTEQLRRLALDTTPPGHQLLLDAWVAVCGDSPVALRGLSLLFYLGAAVFVWLSAREALRGDRASKSASLFAAALFVLSPLQISGATTARMYSMGAFFAALTAWLLLRALGSRGASKTAGDHPGGMVPDPAARILPLARWSAYGAAAAAFCYTHNFAFFTLLAQAAFVAAVCLGRAVANRRARRAGSSSGCIPADDARAAITVSPAMGFLFAAALAAALYSPWLPAARAQSAAVLRDFWIPDLAWAEVSQIFVVWIGGEELALWGKWLAPWLIAVALVAAYTLYRRPGPAAFFLLQAAVPWAACLAVSLASGQSILQDRYLTFAQVGLFGLWGTAWASLRTGFARVALACLLGAPALSGALGKLERLADAEHAALPALRFLAARHLPGDLVLVADARQVNRVRYYARRYGFEPVDVRCPAVLYRGPGHIGGHLASLSAEDVLPPDDLLALPRGRIWRFVDSAGMPPPAPPGFKLVLREAFDGSESRCSLELYVRGE